METDRQRHLHTASYGTELFFQKKKNGLKMKMVSPWAGQDVDMSFLVVGWWIPCGGRQLSWDSMNNKREGSGLE